MRCCSFSFFFCLKSFFFRTTSTGYALYAGYSTGANGKQLFLWKSSIVSKEIRSDIGRAIYMLLRSSEKLLKQLSIAGQFASFLQQNKSNYNLKVSILRQNEFTWLNPILKQQETRMLSKWDSLNELSGIQYWNRYLAVVLITALPNTSEPFQKWKKSKAASHYTENLLLPKTHSEPVRLPWVEK